MRGRLRQSLCLVALGVALPAATAAAQPVRPALGGTPFVAISAAAARSAPVCPNGLVCYSPALLRQAYDFPSGHGAPTGAGQTIVLVEAFGAPDLAADLATFDAENGLPAPASLTVLTQKTPVSGLGSGQTFFWELESTLDVEYAHAMAPGAAIVVGVADTDDSPNLAEIEQEVLPRYPGAIVSQSFGQDETGAFSDPDFTAALEPLFLDAAAHGGTVIASAGDFGATDFTSLGPHPTLMASFPASSPLVLGVGGTMGAPYPGGLWRFPGRYGGEQVWNEPGGAGGGAPSVVFPAPPWQAAIAGSPMRVEPDVSYDAANNGGVIVVLSCPPVPSDGSGGIGACDPTHPLHGVVGGTSVGAPQWAAIVALANELRGRQAEPPVGLVAPLLYALAGDPHAYRQDFHDITIGTNALTGGTTALPGFAAAPGYDIPTGLGTPDVAALSHDIAGRDAHRLHDGELGPPHLQHGRGHDRFLRPGG